MKNKEEYWSDELDKVCNVLSNQNVKWFLDHGTLLGAIRDEKFIPWDNDIDLGVVNINLSLDLIRIKTLVNDFYKLGYSSKYFGDSIYLFKENIEFGIKFYQKNEFNFKGAFIKYEKYNFFSVLYFLATYCFFEKGGKMSFFKNILYSIKLIKIILKPFKKILLAHSNIELVELSIHEKYFKHFKKICFYEKYYNVPKDDIEYLRFKYGENWNVPIKEYNYLLDDGAIK